MTRATQPAQQPVDEEALGRLWCHRPTGLVAPAPLDPTGCAGPTRGQVRSGRWAQVAPRWYVPVEGRPDCVEQRIFEQGARVARIDGGAVTGWASLRWQGAAWFDGLTDDGTGEVPVPLRTSTSTLRAHPASTTSAVHVPPHDRHVVAGLKVTTPLRAVFDEVVAREELWAGVTVISMALSAGLIDDDDLWFYADHRCAWTGIESFRRAWPLATSRCASSREVWLLMAWRAAELPEPLVNEPVFALDGSLIGVPDLFDPGRGFAGEYLGAYHWRSPGQRGRDLARGERFRYHGLRPVEVAQGDTRGAAMHRLRSAWERCAATPPSRRTWTLEKPQWWHEVEERRAKDLRRQRGPWPTVRPPRPFFMPGGDPLPR